MNPPSQAYPTPSGVQQGQPAPFSGPVIYVGAPPQQQYPYEQSQKRTYKNYLSKQSRVLGAIMIVSGILCIIFNVVSLGLGGLKSIILYGIWGGILFIITGSFGVSAARVKTSCKVVTFMILCIISSVIALVVLILAAIATDETRTYRDYYDSYRSYRCYNLYGLYRNTASMCEAIRVFEGMQAILGVIVGIASIWGSTLCCKVACCCQTSTGQSCHSLSLFQYKEINRFSFIHNSSRVVNMSRTQVFINFQCSQAILVLR